MSNAATNIGATTSRIVASIRLDINPLTFGRARIGVAHREDFTFYIDDVVIPELRSRGRGDGGVDREHD